MKTVKYLFVLTLLFSSAVLFSQDISFSHFSAAQGLSQSVVNCLHQDQQGFLWIGTQNGLNRYDGYEFTKYMRNPKDSNTIGDNWIYDVTESGDHIWFGTRNGMHAYNKRTGRFQRYYQKENQIHNNLYSDYVYGIATDNYGNIVANMPPAISILNTATGKIETFVNPALTDRSVSDRKIPISVNAENCYIIGTRQGLFVFNPLEETFEPFHSDLQNLMINDLFHDHEKNLWIGTNHGLFYYNVNDDRMFSFRKTNDPNSLSHNVVLSISQDNNGNYWIGTEGDGLNKLILDHNNPQESEFKHYCHHDRNQHSLFNDIVISLCHDKSGNLWLGTLNGLDKTDLKPKKFKLYKKSEYNNSVDLTDNIIASVFLEDNGILWIGTWGKGLNMLDRATGKVIHYTENRQGSYQITNNYVHIIFKDSNNRIWLGTRKGLMVFNQNTRTFISVDDAFPKNKFTDLSGHRIYTMTEDQSGNLWIGTGNGIYIYKMNNFTSSRMHASEGGYPKICSNLIYDLLEDTKGMIWIGAANGLDCYNPNSNKIKHFSRNADSPNSLCDNFVVTLTEDSRGNLWIGTKNGINKLDRKQQLFTYFSEEDGLSDNMIYESLEDKNGDLWFATANGLNKYSVSTGKFIVYTTEDGLQSMEFNLKAKYQAEDGEIFFGGMNGLNSFYPDSLNVNETAPQIAFTGLEILTHEKTIKKQINHGDIIELRHTDYGFSVYSSVLDFTNPDNNHYVYKLEGLHKDWIDLKNVRYIPFTNLQAGDYTLKIKGSNNDNIWSINPLELQVVVRPPWWKSRYAIITYIILAIVSVIIYIKIRERMLIRERKILETKVEQRTKLLKLQKEKIERSYRNIKMLSEIGQKNN